jgi:hypothetical protein
MVVETKLKQLHLNFKVVEDTDTVVAVGKANKINTAPILKVGDKYYDFAGAIKFLKEGK